jgi:hypothetical protein
MSKFSIGSQVRLLDQVGEGIVTSSLKDGRIMVLLSEGFEIPYYENQLVLIKAAIASGEGPRLTLTEEHQKLSDGLHFLILHQGYIKDEIQVEIRIVNTLKTSFSLVIYKEINAQFELISTAICEFGKSIITGRFGLNELLQTDRFFIHFQAFQKLINKPVLPGSTYIKHTVRKLTEPEAWPLIHEVACRGIGFQIYPEKLHDVKPKNAEKNAHKPNPLLTEEHLLREGPHGRHETDLHIDELLDNTAGMENADIIRYQIRHFNKCLDEAKSRNIRKFVAIHGVGKGRLRDEIRNILKSENIEFQDAPVAMYGWGATEIILK